MVLNDAQKKAAEEVIDALTSATTGARSKRKLAEMFLELPDRDAWSEYYEVIKEPRCIDGIKFKLGRSDRNGYNSVSEVYSDLSLVFSNALYYNEEGSQIAKNASTLKSLLESEWKKHTILSTSSSNTPTAPQKPSKASEQPQAHAQASKTQPPPPHTPRTPAANKSTKALTTATPTQITVSHSTSQAQSQDMEVDVEGDGGQSENEGETGNYGYAGPVSSVSRDAEGDDIVRTLERGLPRWGGYGQHGWMEGANMQRCMNILLAIKTHKDIVSNTRIAASLDAISEDVVVNNASFNFPLSLKLIETKLREDEYSSAKEFDLDMIRLFEKSRKWYDIGSDQYGDVLLLQRLYQALTSSNPPSGPPYTSNTNFASIRAGPGTARPVHGSAASDADLVSGVTTFRISSKDRRFVDEVNYKGWSIRLADWVHLANPDDPNRPIVAQVFKCWISEEPSKAGRPGITACWYYRPEQTYHPANREFWEWEVFKTGHFADHPLEDIIEKIAVQFTARHLRGRPRQPFWCPGWPLYVCDSRYNDRERIFVRIKNWASCVPEEVRKKPDWMRIYEFERAVAPRRLGSPFLPPLSVKGRRGGRLPGGIGEAVERADGEKIEGGGTGRKRSRRPGTVVAASGPGPSRLAPGPSASSNAVQTQASATYGQPQTGTYTQHQSYPTSTTQPQVSTPTSIQPSAQLTSLMSIQERTTLAAAGGASVLSHSFTERLPPETARHFDRDPETNQVLWFSGPPVDAPRAGSLVPKYSLEYLHFLAMKRKREVGKGEENVTHGVEAKRKKGIDVAPSRTMNERLDELFQKAIRDGVTLPV